jgi:hypothetical protein
VYPKSDRLQDAQRSYIIDFYRKYTSRLYSNDGFDPKVGYKKYIDEESLINYVLISELGKNPDAYLFSTYMYKDRDDVDGRIKFGPLWDFDLCFGNAFWQNGHIIDEWQFDFPSNNRLHLRRLFQDTELVDRLADRWFELRAQFLHTDSLHQMIDDYVSQNEAAINRNYYLWPVIDKDVFTPVYQVSSYEEEIQYVKDWISIRADWMDDNIEDIYYPVQEFATYNETVASNTGELKVYPNPVDDHFFMDIALENAGELRVILIDVGGRMIDEIVNTQVAPGNYHLGWFDDNQLAPGYYMLFIKLDNRAIETVPLIKK